MWLSKAVRPWALAAALAATAAVGGCTLTPVYSDANQARSLVQFAYAAPSNRTEQIIYNDLGLRFARSDSPTAPLVAVSASPGGQSLALSSTVNPNKPNQAIVTANLTITPRDGSTTPVVTLTRTASAGYTSNSQAEANAAAFIGASEQAAHAVAEQLRLAILATLARQ